MYDIATNLSLYSISSKVIIGLDGMHDCVLDIGIVGRWCFWCSHLAGFHELPTEAALIDFGHPGSVPFGSVYFCGSRRRTFVGTRYGSQGESGLHTNTCVRLMLYCYGVIDIHSEKPLEKRDNVGYIVAKSTAPRG